MSTVENNGGSWFSQGWGEFRDSVNYHRLAKNDLAANVSQLGQSKSLLDDINYGAKFVSFHTQDSDIGVLLEDFSQSDTSDIQKRRGFGWAKYLPEREHINRGIVIAKHNYSGGLGLVMRGAATVAEVVMTPINFVLDSSRPIADLSEKTRKQGIALTASNEVDGAVVESLARAGSDLFIDKGLERIPFGFEIVEVGFGLSGVDVKGEATEYVGSKARDLVA